MKLDEIKGYDFSEDVLSPDRVMEQLRAHDSRMDEEQPFMSLAKAAYTTKFWRYVEGQEDLSTSHELSRMDQVEVNRIKPALTGYLGSLYPRRIKTVIGQSPYTTGDAKKAEMLVNDWLNQPRMRQRVLLASRQALLYKGAGAKIGYDPAGEGLDRVWMRVFPYWEMILDHDVHDWEDARFVGHCSFQPRQEVIEEYGLDEDLSGTHRDDFLGSYLMGTRRTNDQDDTAVGDQTAFVRVLEFCNLVDDFYDTDGTRYKGRLEIYVLNSLEDSAALLPVYMGPLPLVGARGKPFAHIVPLIFEHEPEYPYRGVSYVDQLMPQQKELNVMRSYLSSAARRDSRIYLAKKGALDADAYSDLKSGEDGLIIEVDEQHAGNLGNVVMPIQHGPVSSNVLQTMQMAEVDLERGTAQSPAALGQVTKATAAEIRAVEGHTQSEFGRHAEARDLWLLQIVQRCLSAHVAAMYDMGDSEGAEEHVDEAGIEKEGRPFEDKEEKEEKEEKKKFDPHMMYSPDSEESEMTETAERHDELEAEGWSHGEKAEEAEEAEEPEDAEDEEVEDDEAEEDQTAEPEREYAEVKRQVQRTIMLLTPNGDFVEVVPEDIDSDFDIGFAEAGRSPFADAEMRQNLVVLSDKLLQLMDLQTKGGAVGIMAEEMWRSLHERFEFPPNLGPDYILAKVAEQEAAAQAAQPAQPPQAPPSPGEAPPEGAPTDVGDFIERVRQLPPSEALEILAEALQGNQEVLDVIQRAQAGGPEDQAQAVEMILSALEQQGG